MKIAEPSATLIEREFTGLSVCQRIDACASVCYQRPPKPTEEEAQAFCRKLIESGHLPALEFAVVHLWIDIEDLDPPSSKYLLWHRGGEIVSGSIRAFMESNAEDLWCGAFLHHHFPSLFIQGVKRINESALGKVDSKIRFATPEEIPWQHKHAAVRVICSRAISHQLVRHRSCSFLQESQRYCRYDDEVVFVRPEWADGEWALFKAQCETSEMMYRARIAKGLSPQQARGALPNDTKTELIMYASLPEWKHIFKLRCAKAADPEARRVMLPLREQFRAEYPEMWEGEK